MVPVSPLAQVSRLYPFFQNCLNGDSFDYFDFYDCILLIMVIIQISKIIVQTSS